MDYEEERKLVPHAVACSRGKMSRRTYDAELVVNGEHYLVGTGLTTTTMAMSQAEVHVDAIRREMVRVGDDYVRKLKLKKARP